MLVPTNTAVLRYILYRILPGAAPRIISFGLVCLLMFIINLLSSSGTASARKSGLHGAVVITIIAFRK